MHSQYTAPVASIGGHHSRQGREFGHNESTMEPAGAKSIEPPKAVKPGIDEPVANSCMNACKKSFLSLPHTSNTALIGLSPWFRAHQKL